MGINFSHCDAQWSYSGFNNFRTRVASIIMETDIDKLYDDRMIYKYISAEPIYPFIDHSDCDGELTPEQLKQIIPQLDDVLNKMEKQNYYRHDVENGKKLLAGMELALKNEENLEFH